MLGQLMTKIQKWLNINEMRRNKIEEQQVKMIVLLGFVQHSGWEREQIFPVSQEIIISGTTKWLSVMRAHAPAVTSEILSQEAPVLPNIINMAMFGQQWQISKLSVSKLSWNLPVGPPAFTVYTPKSEEGEIICVLDKLVLIFLQLWMSLIS